MLIEELGLEGYGIFWILIETLRDQPSFMYPMKLIPSLARKYNTTYDKMKAVITRYELFFFAEENFGSESLIGRMKERDLSRINGIKGSLVRHGHISKEEGKKMSDKAVIEMYDLLKSHKETRGLGRGLGRGLDAGGNKGPSSNKGKERKVKESKIKKIESTPETLFDLQKIYLNYFSENPDQKKVLIEQVGFKGDFEAEVKAFIAHNWETPIFRKKEVEANIGKIYKWLHQSKSFNRSSRAATDSVQDQFKPVYTPPKRYYNG